MKWGILVNNLLAAAWLSVPVLAVEATGSDGVNVVLMDDGGLQSYRQR